MRRPQIAVIGNNVGSPALLAEAERLGTAIVDEGWRIVCGGLGGVMEAAARGARSSAAATGGDVIGILPSERASDANPHVDIVLPSGFGVARNALIVRAADAVVAMAGGSGTLSELAFAWQFGKPIVALTQHEGWSQELAGRCLDTRSAEPIVAAATVVEAIAALRRALGAGVQKP